METREIKILGVVDEDPFHYQTWSGSSSYFFATLKSNNYLCDAISAQPSQAVNCMYKLLSFHANIKKWKFKYQINVDLYTEMTKAALCKIARQSNSDFNFILQIGAWYDLTGMKDKVCISYHDGNLSALLKSPYGYPRVRGNLIRRALEYEGNLYRKMHHIFTMSRWLADSFIKDFGVASSRITPVGAGINLPYVKEITNKSYDDANILFVGKDFERKGGKYLVDAFQIVRREVKNATLTIVGPNLGDLPPGIQCLRGISKSTKEGLDQLLNEYSRATIFVMPSLYEPFGIAFAEAMAHRLPCIGTNICAMPEIIDDGFTGYLVPVMDSKFLAGRIIALLKDARMCEEFGRNAYEKYVRSYTWDGVVRKLTERISNF